MEGSRLRWRLMWGAAALGVLMILAGWQIDRALTLPGPVFAMVDQELQMEEETLIKLPYIASESLEGKIEEASFPQLEDKALVSLYSDWRSYKVGRYQAGQIFLTLASKEGTVLEDDFSVNQIRLRLTDGREEVYEIGNIRFTRTETMDALKLTGSSENSTGIYIRTYEALTDFRLERAEAFDEDYIRSRYEITANGQNIWEMEPVDIKEGDYLQIYIQWKGDQGQNHFYKGQIRLYGLSSLKATEDCMAVIEVQRPEPRDKTVWDAIAYLKERGSL